MKYLLDTHALLWWISNNSSLSGIARSLIADRDNQIYVSAASAWEIATKYRKGKLPSGVLLIPDFSSVVQAKDFISLAISSEHMVQSVLLPGPHKDPFDRILAAQAILETMTLLATDVEIAKLGVLTRW